MNILFTVYVFALFFIFTPGILITLPKKSSKIIVALVHSLLFATILIISGKFSNSVFEGMEPKQTPPIQMQMIKKIEEDIKQNNLKEAEKEVKKMLENKKLSSTLKEHLDNMSKKFELFNGTKSLFIKDLNDILKTINDDSTMKKDVSTLKPEASTLKPEASTVKKDVT
jgi:hypothetical protein